VKPHLASWGVSEVWALCSEQVGLSHNSIELFLADLTVSVAVSLVDHLLNLVVGHILAEFFGDALEILKGDLVCVVVVEQAESLRHLLLGVSFSHLGGHHVAELVVVNDARAVFIDVLDHLLNFCGLWFEAECSHSDFELLLVDVAAAISVEEVEGLLDLLSLLFSELSRFLGALDGGLLVGLLVVRSLAIE